MKYFVLFFGKDLLMQVRGLNPALEQQLTGKLASIAVFMKKGDLVINPD